LELKDDKTHKEFADLGYILVEQKRQECSNIKDCWEFLKGMMIRAAEKVRGRTKGPK